MNRKRSSLSPCFFFHGISNIVFPFLRVYTMSPVQSVYLLPGTYREHGTRGGVRHGVIGGLRGGLVPGDTPGSYPRGPGDSLRALGLSIVGPKPCALCRQRKSVRGRRRFLNRGEASR